MEAEGKAAERIGDVVVVEEVLQGDGEKVREKHAAKGSAWPKTGTVWL